MDKIFYDKDYNYIYISRYINSADRILYLSLQSKSFEKIARMQYSNILISLVDPYISTHTNLNIFWKIDHDFIQHHQIQQKELLSLKHKIQFNKLVKLLLDNNKLYLLAVIHQYMYEFPIMSKGISHNHEPFSFEILAYRLWIDRFYKNYSTSDEKKKFTTKLTIELLTLLLDNNIFQIDTAICRNIYLTNFSDIADITDITDKSDCEFKVNGDIINALDLI